MADCALNRGSGERSPESGVPPHSGRSVFRGAVWSFVERASTQIVAFVVTLVMARILTPADFGLVGMLTLFLEAGSALCVSGMAHALVKQGLNDPRDATAVLVFTGCSGLLIYLAVWLCAPLIADFYGQQSLVPLARLSALVIPLRGLSTVKIAALQGNLDFKRFTIAGLSALLMAGALGIYLSLDGAGVYAIVFFQLSNALFSLIFLWLAAPSQRFGAWRFAAFMRLYRFGRGMMGAAIADIVYNNTYIIAIGRLLPVADVGFFTRARQLASVPPISVSEVIRRVAYPVLCRHDGNRASLIRTTSHILRVSMYLSFPVMLALSFNAPHVVAAVLGEKWASSAPLMGILCLGTLWIPMDVLNLTLLPARGEPGRMFRLELLRKALGILALLCTFPFGMRMICAGFSLAAFISMMITAHAGGKEMGFGLRRQLHELRKIFLFGMLSAGAGGWVASLVGHPWPGMAVGFSVTAVLYLAFSYLFGLPEPRMLADYIRRGRGRGILR